MNDAVNAVETQEDVRAEERDFVELGDVTTETKGLLLGHRSDGGLGTYFTG